MKRMRATVTHHLSYILLHVCCTYMCTATLLPFVHSNGNWSDSFSFRTPWIRVCSSIFFFNIFYYYILRHNASGMQIHGFWAHLISSLSVFSVVPTIHITLCVCVCVLVEREIHVLLLLPLLRSRIAAKWIDERQFMYFICGAQIQNNVGLV